MSQGLVIALITAILNGAVTYGVVSTKLAWLDRDIAKIEHRLELLEAKK
jgi:hypothetical protein